MQSILKLGYIFGRSREVSTKFTLELNRPSEVVVQRVLVNEFKFIEDYERNERRGISCRNLTYTTRRYF